MRAAVIVFVVVVEEIPWVLVTEICLYAIFSKAEIRDTPQTTLLAGFKLTYSRCKLRCVAGFKRKERLP